MFLLTEPSISRITKFNKFFQRVKEEVGSRGLMR